MQSAEIVIVGAGVVGASVAYHLARGGCRDVLVIERHADAWQGSTGRATGGFRAQFSTRINVELSLLAREKLLRFGEELGCDAGYRPCGYLFVARDESQLDALRDAQRLQKSCGLDEAAMLDAQAVGRINPRINHDGVRGGAFCPTDGFIQPRQIQRAYTENAARLGVRFEFGAPLMNLKLEQGRIVSVETPRGKIATRYVVNAAGAWAAEALQQAGANLPVVPMRRQVAVTHPSQLLPEEMPMTIFVEDGFHLRVRDGRVLLLWPDNAPMSDPFSTDVTDEWLAEVVVRAHARVPVLRRATIDRGKCWAGLYEMSPDRHALLGQSAEIENLFLANGSSGHGVMHAPALGQLLAEIMLDGRAHTLDVRALRPSRFAEGESNVSCDFL